eukprot:7183997-Prymnesium_polylepis.1
MTATLARILASHDPCEPRPSDCGTARRSRQPIRARTARNPRDTKAHAAWAMSWLPRDSRCGR